MENWRKSADHEFDHWHELVSKLAKAIGDQKSNLSATIFLLTETNSMPSGDIQQYSRQFVDAPVINQLISQLG